MFLLAGDLVEIGPNDVIFSSGAGQPEHLRLRERALRMTATTSPAPAIRDLGAQPLVRDFQALIDVSVDIRHGIITSLIGPWGCGKTTLLRCFNRVNERYADVRTTGEIHDPGTRTSTRPTCRWSSCASAVGMVFQRPNPLPLSVYENVVFGLRLHRPPRALGRAVLDEAVEQALTETGLWKDLKDRLGSSATDLQLEQQQKLCIARLLPLKPEVILMDEPCSALDVEGTRAIEDLMFQLRGRYTIVIVTHNMAQARRASDECIFMLLGEIIEHRRTEDLFLVPRDRRTAEYIEGRYG